MTTSVAPKERINIVYKSVQEDINVEKELPLKILVIGEFGNYQQKSNLPDRNVIKVNKENFDNVIGGMDVKLNLDIVVDTEVYNQTTAIERINDFSPDKLVGKLDRVDELLRMRNALLMLKGPIGNIPDFRKILESVLQDPVQREMLERQLENNGSDAE